MVRKYKAKRLLQIAALLKSTPKSEILLGILLLYYIFIRTSFCTQSCCPFLETQTCIELVCCKKR